MTFQNTIYNDLPQWIAGQFTSNNPRASVVPPIVGNANVVGANPVAVGKFGWINQSTGLVSSGGNGAPSTVAFVPRTGNVGVNTTYLLNGTMMLQPGQMVTLMRAADVAIAFAAGAAIDQKVYASYLDGSARAGATATPATNVLITANTATNTTLTVTANTGAPIALGQPVSGAGIPAGAYIAAFGTGTGGAGTYTLSVATTATASGVAVTATTDIETRWSVDQVGGAGEAVSCSVRS